MMFVPTVIFLNAQLAWCVGVEGQFDLNQRLNFAFAKLPASVLVGFELEMDREPHRPRSIIIRELPMLFGRGL